MITSKSLHHSNIVFIFDGAKIPVPDNSAFAALYAGANAKGAQFLDDPIIKTKMLTLPALHLRVILEDGRLRVEDESQEEPPKSILAKEAGEIWRKLFPGHQPAAFGFNFDVYFRFNNVIPMQRMFETFFSAGVLEKNDLLDLGVQFTLSKKDGGTEMWAVKITAPLEIATHINRHFNQNKLPEPKDLQTLFENCYYNETDDIVQKFRN